MEIERLRGKLVLSETINDGKLAEANSTGPDTVDESNPLESQETGKRMPDDMSIVSP